MTGVVVDVISPDFGLSFILERCIPFGEVHILLFLIIILYRWRERRQFNGHFRPLPRNRSERYVAVSIVAAVFGVLFIQWMWSYFDLPASWLQLASQGFVLVFVILYWVGLFSVAPSYYGDVVDYLNSAVPDTQIRVEGNALGKEMVRMAGRFQKANIDFRLDFPSQRFQGLNWRRGVNPETKIRLSCSLTGLSGGPVKTIQIKDNKRRWIILWGQGVDDCFRQRFSVTGAKTSDLPMGLKVALLHYPKPIDLTLKRDGVVFSAVYTHQPPYQTREGMILLWVDLLDWFGKM